MVAVKICGGLGNQLFQYACARRLAHVKGAELVLDLSWFSHRPSSNTSREYELDRYPIHARTPTTGEMFWLKLHQGRFMRRVPFIPRHWDHYREQGFAFDPLVLNLPDNVYMDGYWQSYKYFEDVASMIRSELIAQDTMSDMDQLVANKIMKANREAVSLHVRRGDYVTNPASARTHGLCTLDYYVKGIESLACQLNDPHFFVFSDDMPWVRSNMSLPGEVTYVEHNGPETAFQDLRLMSLCNHHIIANSSFSWWGAWLHGDDGCVIAPAKWFADCRNTDDLTPKHWTRL